jgi:hypothetical protein
VYPKRTGPTHHTGIVAADHPLLCREDLLFKLLVRSAEVSPAREILSRGSTPSFLRKLAEEISEEFEEALF